MNNDNAAETREDNSNHTGQPQLAWQSFVDAPGRHITPELLAAAFDGGISVELAQNLQACDRIQRQIKHLITGYYELPDLSVDDELPRTVVGLLQLTFDELDDLALQAGAIFWSQTIVGEIRANEIATMKRELGSDIITTAHKHRDLGHDNPQPAGAMSFEAAVKRDGLACIASCVASASEQAQAWLKLRFPACISATNGFQQPASQKLALQIVERLLAERLPTTGHEADV